LIRKLVYRSSARSDY